MNSTSRLAFSASHWRFCGCAIWGDFAKLQLSAVVWQLAATGSATPRALTRLIGAPATSNSTQRPCIMFNSRAPSGPSLPASDSAPLSDPASHALLPPDLLQRIQSNDTHVSIASSRDMSHPRISPTSHPSPPLHHSSLACACVAPS